MKRDMELVRTILFAIEDQFISGCICNLEIDGYDQNTVGYHCQLMFENGLIDAFKADGYDDEPMAVFFVGNLTWEGYDFLEKIRQDTIWNKIKSCITQKGLPFVFEVVKEISTSVLNDSLQNLLP